MADDEVPREGFLGWGRLGCAWVGLGVVPLWITLIGAFMGSRPGWLEDRGLTDVTWLGLSFGSWFALFAGTGTLAVLLSLAAFGLLAATALGRWREGRAIRATKGRWDAVVGDGDVLKSDAWGKPDAGDPADEVTESIDADPRVDGSG